MTHVAQVGGTHYEGGRSGNQHWDLMEAWDVGYLEAQATRYIIRWDKKGKPVEDLQKAVSYLQKLLLNRDEVRRRVPLQALFEFAKDNDLDSWKFQMLWTILGVGLKKNLEDAMANLIKVAEYEQAKQQGAT